MNDLFLKLLPKDSFPQVKIDLIPELQSSVLNWHIQYGRHDLPWTTVDPYRVWISEVMLQQTQVVTGLIRYPKWFEKFPTLLDLANASQDQVLEEWEGLGYYARARNLHKAAIQVKNLHDGIFPEEREFRLALPGVGPSTASAIGSFAFGKKEAIFDGNVERVWSRWWGDEAPQDINKFKLFGWSWAQCVMPSTSSEIRSWTQAIMDLGATICTPKNPLCIQCPLKSTCRAHQLGKETSWPLKKTKIKVQNMNIRWFWDIKNEKVGVIQRPNFGIWGGLWTPIESGEDIVKCISSGKQKLSHRNVFWEIGIGNVFPDFENVVWVDMAQFDNLALPKPLRLWWSSLSLDERQLLFKDLKNE